MEKICLICQKRFKVSTDLAIIQRENRKYCSLKCYWESPTNKQTRFQKGHKGLPQALNPAWKGGRNIDEKGYVRIAIGKKKYRYEHRLIMEKYINRPLKKTEQIHHINGNKTDNNISNLILFPSASAHTKHHLSFSKLSS